VQSVTDHCQTVNAFLNTMRELLARPEMLAQVIQENADILADDCRRASTAFGAVSDLISDLLPE